MHYERYANTAAKRPVEQLRSDAPLNVDWTLSFDRSIGRQAYEYWNVLRGARAMPARGALRPAQMRKFLTHVNLVEITSDAAGLPDYRVCLQGQHGQSVFGTLTKGPLKECLAPVTGNRLRYVFGLAAGEKRPVRISAQVTAGDQTWLQCEILLAPLGNERGEVTSLFWVFDSWTAL
jgi:hypothetical protein